MRNVGYKAVRPARGRAPLSGPDEENGEPEPDDLEDPLVDPLRSQ